jgi:hypothetical protein
MANQSEALKKPSNTEMACILIPVLIGMFVAKAVAKNLFPPQGPGFDMNQVIAAAIGGGLGGLLGKGVWSLTLGRKVQQTKSE